MSRRTRRFCYNSANADLRGDGAAARATLAVIEEAKVSTDHGFIRTIVRVIVTPGSVTSAPVPLRMARKLDPYRETARMPLEPWLVEAATARQSRRSRDRRDGHSHPNKVKWPKWWSEHP